MDILLIEDNEKISENIKKYLELEGFSVDISYNGED
jgi:DNA-binding response OmpR family regulator